MNKKEATIYRLYSNEDKVKVLEEGNYTVNQLFSRMVIGEEYYISETNLGIIELDTFGNINDATCLHDAVVDLWIEGKFVDRLQLSFNLIDEYCRIITRVSKDIFILDSYKSFGLSPKDIERRKKERFTRFVAATNHRKNYNKMLEVRDRMALRKLSKEFMTDSSSVIL